MIKLTEIPKSFMGELGTDAHKYMGEFFINTKGYVQSRLKCSEDYYFEIKSSHFTNIRKDKEKIELDNRITYVEFKEKYIIAGMIETRTAFNYSQFTFFRDLSWLEKEIKNELLGPSF